MIILLKSVNRLLIQSIQVMEEVNKDKQWNFATDAELERTVSVTETLIRKLSDYVFQKKKIKRR